MSGLRDLEISRHHHILFKESLQTLNVKLGFGVGDLDVSEFEKPDTLFEGNYENKKPLRFRIFEDEVQIIIGDWSSMEWFPRFWYFLGDCHIKLNKQLPLRLALTSRIGDTNLDFSELKAKDLRIRYLIGDLDVLFSEVESCLGSIVYTLGDITLTVPSELGVRIKLGPSIMAAPHFEEGMLQRFGANYISRSFDKARNFLDLSIDYHLGDLKIRNV
jgi:hypothetical protein